MPEIALDDLRTIHELLAPAATTPPQLLAVIETAITLHSPGVQVFHLELPTGAEERDRVKARKKSGLGAKVVAWAPSMNEYSGMLGWQRAKIRTAIDTFIKDSIPHWPNWFAGHKTEAKIVDKKKGLATVKVVVKTRIGGRKRMVRVTRFSPRKLDELSVDIIGGKIPLDRLVEAGILVDDDPIALIRETAWYPCGDSQPRVVIEVFELPGRPIVERKKHSKRLVADGLIAGAPARPRAPPKTATKRRRRPIKTSSPSA